MDRVILHSDMNSYYASVEMMLNPKLKGKVMAVGGSTENRNGIILAKSEKAKKAGVKTGMALWEARQVCPDIVIVPPQYEEYIKYSKIARDIYARYTDRVESLGMDECWLDVTESAGLFGDAEKIAEEIRNTMKNELGLTVSVGVSYNKIFAKLGSDMKKPDAVTVITRDNFKEKVWPLPVGDLLFVGRATRSKLNRCGVNTIGDLAKYPDIYLKSKFGKNGLLIASYARGQDIAPVTAIDYRMPIKSVGHGITCVADLENNTEVFAVMQELTQEIGQKLRKHGLAARGVQISVRDKNLFDKQWQRQMEHSTQCASDISSAAKQLFADSYRWKENVRSVTVRAINLIPAEMPTQMSFFDDVEKRERALRLENTIDEIRRRFGYKAVTYATLMGDLKMPDYSDYRPKMPALASR